MPSSKKGKDSSRKTTRTDRAAEIANTFEWLITAFILAFLFRAFVMEAFRIPTGSMADTLKGAHFRLRCRQCGYEYDYGFVPEKYGFARDHVPRAPIRECWSRCPSCGFYQRTGGTMPVANGDRILVLKCIYQFFEPKQWDVLVFKDPLDPSINYIKRLVGRPGEKVEIIDGDVYINDRISRKPPKVQNSLFFQCRAHLINTRGSSRLETRMGRNGKLIHLTPLAFALTLSATKRIRWFMVRQSAMISG